LSRGQGARANAINTRKPLGPGGDANKTTSCARQTTRPRERIGVVAAALLAGAAIGGWAVSTVSATSAVPVADLSALEMVRKNAVRTLPDDELKLRLVGSYAVSGTDPDGRPYAGAGIVDVALAPSGALELDWDNGKQVGVARMIGDVLVVACSIKGRTAILTMTINPDGSLSGTWLRRTDRGQKGTETWKKA
jgi:hypothetical protein